VILVAVLFGALNAHKTWALLPDWPLPILLVAKKHGTAICRNSGGQQPNVDLLPAIRRTKFSFMAP